MARNFNTNDIITFPVPSALIGVDGGPLTVVVIAKLNASAYHVPIYTKTSGGTNAWSMEYDTTGGLHANYVTGTTNRNVGSVSTGAFFVSIFRKDASGSFQPVGRFLTGTGFTTDSGNITAASTLIDGPALDSGGTLQFGRWGTVDYSNDMDVSAVAVWNSYVADGTVTGFTTWSAITTASPTYWAKFEGTTVTDSASQTPTITGTTTASDPSGFFGAADQTINGNGIKSAEELGNTQVSPAIAGGGIPTAEALGNAAITTTYTITAHGIESAEKLGNAAVGLVITPSGVATSEAVGSPTITPGAVTVSANGVESAEKLGSATVTPGTVTITAHGIVSGETLGSPTVIIAQSINAHGIDSSERFGSPTVTPGTATVSAAGITSSEVLGSPQLNLSVTASGIQTSEALGSPTITVTDIFINASGIVSTEQVGSPTVAATYTISASGVTSNEVVGNATTYSAINGFGIESSERLGSPTISVGSVTVNAFGIISQESFGLTTVTALSLVPPTPDTAIQMVTGRSLISQDPGQTTLEFEDSETVIAL